MSLTIRFVAAIDTEQGSSLGEGDVVEVLEDAGLTPRDADSYGLTPRRGDPRYLLLRATVVADDPQTVTQSVRQVLLERGAALVDFRFTAEPQEPTEIQAPGVTFDKATGTLRVEATDEDLSLELIRGSDSITGVLTSRRGDAVVQEGVGGVQRVIIARAGAPEE